MTCRTSIFAHTGDSEKGVSACRHADVQLKVAEGMKRAEIWIVMFKVCLQSGRDNIHISP